MTTFSQNTFFLFCRQLTFIMQCLKFAKPFFIAFALFAAFKFLWLDQVFSQPFPIA